MPVDYADEVGQGSRHNHEEGYVSCWGYTFTLHCAYLNCGLCFIHVVEVFILTVVQWRLNVFSMNGKLTNTQIFSFQLLHTTFRPPEDSK